MKRSFLLLLLAVSALAVNAQLAVDTLHENFDVACVTSTTGPYNAWSVHTPVSGTNPLGAWHCSQTDGRSGTPGMECTGTYSSVYHLDTSYLITPLLNLSSYTGNVYIRFDTKTTNINLGGRFSLIEAKLPDSTISIFTDDTDFTGAELPIISNGDSSNWVTHQADISIFKDRGDFYLAFRYTSTTTTGSTWYLDNVNIDTTSDLGIPNPSKEILPLKAIGVSTTSQVTLAYNVPAAGTYQLVLYDIMGQVVYKEALNAREGNTTYTINNLNLHTGMYLVRMTGSNSYGMAKVMIW